MKLVTSLLIIVGASAYAQTAPADLPPPAPEAPAVAPVVPVPTPTPAPVPVPVDPDRHYEYAVPEQHPAPAPVQPVAVRPTAGLGINIGGGVTQYFAQEANRVANLGPDWTARLLVGSRSFLAGEAAYVGSTQQIEGLAPNLKGPQLMAHGVEGLLRANFTRSTVQPYIAAGIGFKRFDVINTGGTTVATSDVSDSANVGYVPGAAGIAFRSGGLILDGRFGVDVPFTRPAIRTVSMNAGATAWNLNANIGWEF